MILGYKEGGISLPLLPLLKSMPAKEAKPPRELLNFGLDVCSTKVVLAL